LEGGELILENNNLQLFNNQMENLGKMLKTLNDTIQDSLLPYKRAQEEFSKIIESSTESLRNISKSIGDSLNPFFETLEEFSQMQTEIFDKFKALGILQSPLTAKQSEDVEYIYSSIIDKAIEDNIIINDDLIVENLEDSVSKKPMTWKKFFEILFGLITIITFIQGFLPKPKPEPIKEYTNYLEKLVNIETQQLKNQDYQTEQIKELKTLIETLKPYIHNQTLADEPLSHTQSDSNSDSTLGKTSHSDFDLE